MRITCSRAASAPPASCAACAAAAPDAEITVIGNTGDDITLFGLRVCPDLDTVMYTLGGGINEEQGWGRADETFTVKEELAAYGVGPDWFGLGDRDFATHIVRTQMLGAGYPLSAVTEALCARWQPGRAAAADDRRPGRDPRGHRRRARAERAVHFQEWWVRLHAAVPGARRSSPVGADDGQARARACSRPSPTADVVLFPPSNPVVSIGTILAVPGIRGRGRRPRPWSGSPRSSAARRCAAWPTPAWPRSAWRPRPRRSPRTTGPALLDGWLVDDQDKPAADDPASWPGSRCRAVPLLMTRPAPPPRRSPAPRSTWPWS